MGSDLPARRHEAVIENGLLIGKIGKAGKRESLKAMVDGDGNVRDGQVGVRKFDGRISGTSGRGAISGATSA
ncbi:MAG: hypothetical protein QF449_12780 [Alphaproteobacteria bacterium]|jgi:hypothetical protein|nr:hypothetical protein [Alphaproteobacteria bacterium]MDP6588802.1 hypothetical protein [Alphaproteobacteria bacterium]MDP6818904.1 hypothetical protein [Alphaproteobacteria bacterium]|tara:strand:- start:661 stop:876 length:216 start_codon:yes stop_codon:yes gene_type:complete